MLVEPFPPRLPTSDNNTHNGNNYRAKGKNKTTPNTNSINAVEGDNPLTWSILSLLQASSQSWKVHHLATQLYTAGLMQKLDDNPQKDLFKRNFLLMNALFTLQQLLLPEHWLRVKAMDIQILPILPHDLSTSLSEDDALRDYYQDWQHYDTCPNIIAEMLESFWRRYDDYIGTDPIVMDDCQALKIFELTSGASHHDIRRQWTKLALKWHPDRPEGNAAQFRKVCAAWQILRQK